jgi:nicotinate-nucleotide adenylyltransferase
VAGSWNRPVAPLTHRGSPAAPRRRRVGLLGGSFNPAHGGHRRVSLFAQQALGLDEVWWLVSPGNPLKDPAGMAPLAARFASAARLARRAPITVSAIERELGTRYTVDTLRALRQRWPKRDFVWLMGADNLAQFHRWRDWRGIARTMPIAVVARPGYDGIAVASPAMAWLRRYRTAAASLKRPVKWSAPALVLLRFDPDSRSATALRRTEPDWAKRLSPGCLRDGLTRRRLSPTHSPTRMSEPAR